MKPKLMNGEYVFCTIQNMDSQTRNLNALCTFQEKEGTTLILKKVIAVKNNLSYSGVWSLITCTVHSDLNAIGLIAVISNKLAQAQISVNIVSAYYHDHLFVPQKDGSRALKILNDLSLTV
jgi:hypothetical protein